MPGAPITFLEYHDAGPSDAPGWKPLSSRSELSDPITEMTVVTWNVWFDKVEKHKRFSGVINEILKLRNVDVVCLQEVTPEFIEWLQLCGEFRTDWILTNCWDSGHQREIPSNWYGCIFLMKKKWGGNVRAWVKKFPTSKMGRFVVMAEVFKGNKSMVLSFMTFGDKDSNRKRPHGFSLS